MRPRHYVITLVLLLALDAWAWGSVIAILH
jgi:hypothetical protein